MSLFFYPTRPDLFFDSSALFAGVVSAVGAARALLLLAEAGAIRITVSEQVIVETERALARKRLQALPVFRETLRAANIRIARDPSPAEVAAWRGAIAHEADLPILVAAIAAQTDFLVTLNRRHFVDDPEVRRRSGLRIGAPGEALIWTRSRLYRDEMQLREYTDDELEQMLADDQIDEATAATIRRLLASGEL